MRLVPGVLLAVLLITPQTSAAQTTLASPGTPAEARFFVDANLFAAAWSVAHEREFTALFVQSGELATFRARYPKPSLGLSFLDLGGGVMFHRRLGVGVSVVLTTYKDTADLEATIPHPFFLNAAATDSGVTNRTLKRDETALHFFVALVPFQTARAELRVYGGPSYFAYSAEMVKEIAYTQQASDTTPQNAITVTGFTSEKATGDGWGYHLGGDYTYFFNRLFGVAGGVRFSYGTVTVDREPLSTLEQQFRVGSTAVFAGVRFRFGH